MQWCYNSNATTSSTLFKSSESIVESIGAHGVAKQALVVRQTKKLTLVFRIIMGCCDWWYMCGGDQHNTNILHKLKRSKRFSFVENLFPLCILRNLLWKFHFFKFYVGTSRCCSVHHFPIENWITFCLLLKMSFILLFFFLKW